MEIAKYGFVESRTENMPTKVCTGVFLAVKPGHRRLPPPGSQSHADSEPQLFCHQGPGHRTHQDGHRQGAIEGRLGATPGRRADVSLFLTVLGE